jgi:hypothetical protein
MEQLLNLFWLMLVLPAFFLWRFQLSPAQSSWKRGKSHSFILLGCLLFLLFPVVSVSDDLHPINAEIEESGPFKRTVKQSLSIKSSPSNSHGTAPALPVSVALPWPAHAEVCVATEHCPVFPSDAFATGGDSRAPPEI